MKLLSKNPPLLGCIFAFILYGIGIIFQPDLLNYQLVVNILMLSAFLGIMSIGQTLVVIAGNEGIDLSIGSVVTLSAIIVYGVVNGNDNMIVPALIIALILGVLIGTINGVGVVLFNIPPLIMTLGMTGVIQGLMLVITRGKLEGKAAPLMQTLFAKPILFNIPGVIYLWVLLGVLVWLLLNKSVFGKQLYAIGTNRIAAKISGIYTEVIAITAYGLSGFFATLGGFVLLAYTEKVFLNLGAVYTMPTVAAVVMGGTLLSGGKGSYTGTIVGALVLTLINTLLNTFSLDESYRQIIYGSLLILLLALYGRQKKLRN